jgi:hypothetical protein
MKTLIWSLFALFALLWTGAAWGTAALLRWAAGATVSDGPWAIEGIGISLRIPAWLEPWIDMGWLLALLDSARMLADWLHGLWPHAGQLAGAVSLLVWVAWGLVLMLALALTLGLHLAIRVATPASAPRAGSPGAV